MTAINFAQISYIDHWDSKQWVKIWLVIVPSTVYAALTVTLLVVVFLSRAEIHQQWAPVNDPDVDCKYSVFRTIASNREPLTWSQGAREQLGLV